MDSEATSLKQFFIEVKEEEKEEEEEEEEEEETCHFRGILRLPVPPNEAELAVGLKSHQSQPVCYGVWGGTL